MRKIAVLVYLLTISIYSFGQGESGFTIEAELLDRTSNLQYYPAQPYQSEGAGYNGAELENLASENIVTFIPKEQGNVAAELNAIIDELSNSGGGKITIPKGDYIMRQVKLKSNIHITIESGTTIKMDEKTQGKKMIFLIGSDEGEPCVENVRIVGLGSPEDRPELILERYQDNYPYRAIYLGYTKNVLIENFTIVDNMTKGAAIAFNPVKVNDDFANIPENVTVTNVSLMGGSIGYGLAQTNVGKNILLKNLYCQGGVTCRIEAHTGRQYDIGTDNIVIKNVVSKNGKAAVLLQPHSVENGRVFVDRAISDGSTWTLFLKEGFVGKDSKRREKGSYAASSTFKNIGLISTNNTATLSYKNFRFVPIELHEFYKNPDFISVSNDVNNLTEDGQLANESAVVGSSVAVVYIDATYPMNLPVKDEIVLLGETEHRLKILNSNQASAIDDALFPNSEIVRIYPNPTSGNFTFDFSNRQTFVTIEVHDLSGKIMESNIFENVNNASCSIGGLTQGIYVVMLHMDNGSQSFILQKI